MSESLPRSSELSDPSKLRLLHSSTPAEAVTVHEDGRLQTGDDAALDLAAREQAKAAADIVGNARRQAAELLRVGAERAAAARHDAHRGGREQGYRDGAAAAHAEVADALALVQQITLQAKALRDSLLEEAERELVELVIASVEAILGEQVRLEPTLVLDTVERALKRAGAQNVVRIRVNPQDRELLSAQLAARAGDVAATWAVTADGAVGVGGCVIDTERGEVDARLDVQLEEIARAFRSARSSTAEAGEAALRGAESGEAQADAA